MNVYKHYLETRNIKSVYWPFIHISLIMYLLITFGS